LFKPGTDNYGSSFHASRRGSPQVGSPLPPCHVLSDLCSVEEGENRIYEHNDPPLSDRGRQEASLVGLSFTPDLVLVSPMIRALDTVLLMLDHSRPTIIIDPELRPAHDHAYNQGSSRSILASKYTDFDFSECSPSGRYEPCTEAETCRRAIKVLDRLSHYLQYYSNIVVVTHRGLLRYLDPFPTKVFRNCGKRVFHLLSGHELIYNFFRNPILYSFYQI
jgi:broad specificity phosphatase PhoE